MLLAIAALVALYVFIVYDRLIGLMWLARGLHLVLAVLVASAPGLLMGICFPIGIQLARRRSLAFVPWDWG